MSQSLAQGEEDIQFRLFPPARAHPGNRGARRSSGTARALRASSLTRLRALPIEPHPGPHPPPRHREARLHAHPSPLEQAGGDQGLARPGDRALVHEGERGQALHLSEGALREQSLQGLWALQRAHQLLQRAGNRRQHPGQPILYVLDEPPLQQEALAPAHLLEQRLHLGPLLSVLVLQQLRVLRPQPGHALGQREAVHPRVGQHARGPIQRDGESLRSRSGDRCPGGP